MLGGALACGVTHAGITPLDVAKCNMQVDYFPPGPPIFYSSSFANPQVSPTKYVGLTSSVRLLLKEEGANGIWKGFGPTLVGYSLQGMFKYGLYEVFKDFYSNMAGEEAANKYKPIIWLAGSASAEVFADIALCPLEMTKVKIQTSQNGTFPTAFGAAIREMSRTRVETRYPFGSIVPLWSRQVCARFTSLALLTCCWFRSLIPWPNSSALRRLFNFSTLTSSLNPRTPTPRLPNSALPLDPVISPV